MVAQDRDGLQGISRFQNLQAATFKFRYDVHSNKWLRMPVATERAPYFTEFVASSWMISASVVAACSPSRRSRPD